MVCKIIPISSVDCIILCGNSDLASRKLLPALYPCQCVGQFSKPTRTIEVSHTFLKS